MIKGLLKLGIFLFIGIVAYNYFFGTPEEKASSEAIVGKVKDIGKTGIGLIKGEAAKFKEGKYDGALTKVGDAVKKAKEKVKEGGLKLKEIQEWEKRKDEWLGKRDQLQEDLDAGSIKEDEAKATIKDLEAEFEKLKEEGESLGVDME